MTSGFLKRSPERSEGASDPARLVDPLLHRLDAETVAEMNDMEGALAWDGGEHEIITATIELFNSVLGPLDRVRRDRTLGCGSWGRRTRCGLRCGFVRGLGRDRFLAPRKGLTRSSYLRPDRTLAGGGICGSG